MSVFVLYAYESAPIAVAQTKEWLATAAKANFNENISHFSKETPEAEIQDGIVIVRGHGISMMYEYVELALLP